MKLNQTVQIRTNYDYMQSAEVTPRAKRVELGHTVLGRHNLMIDADSAISLGTALIEAGNVTRHRQYEEEMRRMSSGTSLMTGRDVLENTELLSDVLSRLNQISLISLAERLKATNSYSRDAADVLHRLAVRPEA